MNETLSNIFGANWRTTITGLLSAIWLAYRDSALEDPLDFRRWIGPVLVAAIGFFAKDKLVTGGRVTQDSKGRYSGVNTSISTVTSAPTKTDNYK